MRLVLLLVLALAAAHGVVLAQGDIGTISTDSGVGVQGSVATQTVGSSGPTEVATLPRNPRPYWHVFIAFAIAWGLLFVYAITLGRRFSVLEAQVKQLKDN